MNIKQVERLERLTLLLLLVFSVLGLYMAWGHGFWWCSAAVIGGFILALIVSLPLIGLLEKKKKHILDYFDQNPEIVDELFRFRDQIVSDLTSRPTSSADIVDLRSPEDRQIEQEAKSAKKYGPEFDSLLAELIALAREKKLLASSPGGEFNERSRNIRGVQIAEELHKLGGYDLMRVAYYQFEKSMPGDSARELNYVFDGVGGWMA